MFFGWFDFGNRGLNRSGGCLFLPLVLVCGGVFLFGGRNNGCWFGLLLVGVVWLALQFTMGRRTNIDDPEIVVYAKPKRGEIDEKPKRDDTRYELGDDGELIETERDPGDYPSPTAR